MRGGLVYGGGDLGTEIDRDSGVSGHLRGLNAANGPLRAALNWPALNELDTADPTITARLRPLREMHCV